MVAIPEADRFVHMLDDLVDQPRMVRRLEVIAGASGRRRWSAAEKARILEEVFEPSAIVSEIARRHGMTPQHFFTGVVKR
jgi:transposase